MPPPAPVDYLTAEPDKMTDDEIVAALVAVLEQIQAVLPQGAADDVHVVRCVGCGSWAWDEKPCPTCARARRHARRAVA